jgi:hypothetical protein
MATFHEKITLSITTSWAFHFFEALLYINKLAYHVAKSLFVAMLHHTKFVDEQQCLLSYSFLLI